MLMVAIQFVYLTLVRTIVTWSNIEKVNGDFMLKNPLLAPIFEPTTFWRGQSLSLQLDILRRKVLPLTSSSLCLEFWKIGDVANFLGLVLNTFRITVCLKVDGSVTGGCWSRRWAATPLDLQALGMIAGDCNSGYGSHCLVPKCTGYQLEHVRSSQKGPKPVRCVYDVKQLCWIVVLAKIFAWKISFKNVYLLAFNL